MADKNDLFYDPSFDYDHDGKLDPFEEGDMTALYYQLSRSDRPSRSERLRQYDDDRFREKVEKALEREAEIRLAEHEELTFLRPKDSGPLTEEGWRDHFSGVRERQTRFLRIRRLRAISVGTFFVIVFLLELVNVFLVASKTAVSKAAAVSVGEGLAFIIGFLIGVFGIGFTIRQTFLYWKEKKERYDRMSALCDRYEEIVMEGFREPPDDGGDQRADAPEGS